MKFFYLISFYLIVTISIFAQDKPLTILEKPTPELPKEYGTLDVQGTIRFRVEFLASGKIGNVVPLKRMDVGDLTSLAEAATHQIKFTPKIIEGNPVTSNKLVEYMYSYLKSGWIVDDNILGKSKINSDTSVQAEDVLKKAVLIMGGDKYLNVRTQIGRGRFSVIRGGVIASLQTFVDVMVLPDKNRTDFKGGGVKIVQSNAGDTGWVYDGNVEEIRDQTEIQLSNFRRGTRVSLDNLLRGKWRGEAKLSYVGRRQASLGKRNDVVKLTYEDGFTVEFEFADDGLPQKAVFKRTTPSGEEFIEEDRYAQFIVVDGIRSPFIIDRFSNGQHMSRINYDRVEYNKSIDNSVFAKPTDVRQTKKDLKL